MDNFEEKQKNTAKRLGISVEKLPRHIAIIMDGNGRWALQRNLPRVVGHRKGGETVERIATHCVNLGIESLTLYSFSIENWKRPSSEIRTLMGLYTQYLVKTRSTLMKNNIRLIHLGRLQQLPENVRGTLLETVKMTADNSGMILALALNYSGRAELTDAARKIAQECKDEKLNIDDIDEGCISQHLYVPSLAEPDLLIRSANERRISNFLLWQVSYSEFYVSKVLWPDFTENDLEDAIRDYAKRERRFGDIKPKE
jgi:undecaprenyl diphosphate synthase